MPKNHATPLECSALFVEEIKGKKLTHVIK
jgi:hypothetical protein